MMKSRGFTLVELLVVISIIGLLASLVIAQLGTSQAKSRNAGRKSDLITIDNALQRYINEPNSGELYPASGPLDGNIGEVWLQSSVISASNQAGMAALMASGHLPSVPKPRRVNEKYLYHVNWIGWSIVNACPYVISAGKAYRSEYILSARLEAPTDPTRPWWNIRSNQSRAEDSCNYFAYFNQYTW